MGYESRRRQRRSIRLQGYDYTQAGAYFVTVCVQGRECFLGQVVDGEMWLSEAGRMVQSAWDALPAHYPGVDIDAFAVMPNHIHGIIILTGHNVGATPRGCPDDRGPDNVVAPGVVGATPRGCPDDGCPDNVAADGQARGPAPTDGAAGVVGAPPRGCPDDGGRRDAVVDGQARGPVDGQARGPAPTDGVDGAAGLSLPDVVHRFKSFTTAQYRRGVKDEGWTPFPGRLWQRNYYEHVIRNDDELSRIRRYIEENPAQWAMDRENPAHG